MGAMSELFASKLRAARETVGITKYRLAKDAGLSQPYLTQIESGKNVPGPAAIAKLAQVLGVPADTMQAWADADRIGEQGLIHLRTVMDRSGDTDHSGQKPGNHDESMVSAKLDARTKEPQGIKDSQQVQRNPSLGDSLGEIPITGLVRIPVFGVVSCGEPVWMPEQALEFLTLPENFTEGAEAAIVVKGHSMVGCGYIEGDYLLVRRLDGEKPNSGDDVIVCVEGEYTCAVYRSNDLGEYLEKRPDFGEAKLYPVRGETRIYALVIWHIKRKRK